MVPRLAGLLVLAAASASQAQGAKPFDWSGWTNPAPAIDVMAARHSQSKVLERVIQRKVGVVASPFTHHPLSVTDLKPAKRGPTAGALAASFRNLDAKERKEFAQMLDDGLTQTEGDPAFRKHNLAQAIAYLLAAAIWVLDDGEPVDEELGQVIAALNDILGDDRAFRAMPAKDKQRLYEGAILTAGILTGLHSSAVSAQDEAAQTQLKQVARATLARFGFK